MTRLYVLSVWILYGVCLFLAEEASRLSFSSKANQNPLEDVIHSNFPDFDHTDQTKWTYNLPDKLLGLIWVATVLMGLGQGLPTALNLGLEWCKLHGLLMLMRSSLVLVTTIPSPVVSCRNATVPPVLPGFVVQVYCNDLLFSGHTATNILMGVFWSASPSPVPLKLTIWTLILLACFTACVTRDHYTADVLVAVYISFLLGWSRSETLRKIFSKNKTD